MKLDRYKKAPPLERVREALDYNPDTGVFTWKIFLRNNSIKPGFIASSRNGFKGYRCLHLDGQSYLCHRLAWYYVHGVWPKVQIDHINRDRSDNRISNLREATRSQNIKNTSPIRKSKSGIKGIWWRPERGRWIVKFRMNGKPKQFGSFSTREEALAAYKVAAAKYHGEFASYPEDLDGR